LTAPITTSVATRLALNVRLRNSARLKSGVGDVTVWTTKK